MSSASSVVSMLHPHIGIAATTSTDHRSHSANPCLRRIFSIQNTEPTPDNYSATKYDNRQRHQSDMPPHNRDGN